MCNSSFFYFAILAIVFGLIPIFCLSIIYKDQVPAKKLIPAAITLVTIFVSLIFIEIAIETTDKIVTFDNKNNPTDSGHIAFCRRKCANVHSSYEVKSSVLFNAESRIKRVSYTIAVRPIHLVNFFKAINVYPNDALLSLEDVRQAVESKVKYHLYEMNKERYGVFGEFDNPQETKQQEMFKLIVSQYLSDRLDQMGLRIIDVPNFELE